MLARLFRSRLLVKVLGWLFTYQDQRSCFMLILCETTLYLTNWQFGLE